MLLSCILYLDFYSTQSTMQVDTITQLYNISRISVKMETAFFLSKECAACNFTVPSWRKWHVSSKEMQLCTKPHSVTSQKKTIFVHYRLYKRMLQDPTVSQLNQFRTFNITILHPLTRTSSKRSLLFSVSPEALCISHSCCACYICHITQYPSSFVEVFGE